MTESSESTSFVWKVLSFEKEIFAYIVTLIKQDI